MTRKLLLRMLILAIGVSGCGQPGAPSGDSSLAASGPRAWFDAPLPGTVFHPPDPCQIVAHGASPNGIAMFELTVNGAATSIPSPDTQSSLVTLTQECGLTDPGTYMFQLRLQDNDGNWSGFAETSLIIAAAEAAACTNKMDVTFEDPLQKTYMTPGQIFTKSWTVQNTGTCTWGEGYHLMFEGGPSLSQGGASMGGPLDSLLGSLVSIPVVPGQSVTLALPQTAPMDEGWYVGSWKLLAPNGQAMPSVCLCADIVVKSAAPAAQAAIEVLRISTDRVSYEGGASCSPMQVTISARAADPAGIKAVVLFYQLRNKDSGEATDFFSGAMTPQGGDLYSIVVNPADDIISEVGFPGAGEGVLQYQAVIQNDAGDTSTRTPLLSDISVVGC